ncbi:LCP family protein [Deinococcus phoenicis]|uniref:LCP family protein n=1 Tax=Deinococcus phoenicis TaxID=1476583 RepID=UPI001F27F800|nr:LCP family protein [Deinococcus phoenicis]
MRRWWRAGAAGLCLAGALLALWLFRTHQQIQTVGVQVYREFEGDGLPLQPGVLDDPIFQALPPPPPDRPVSPGRYRAPASPEPAAEAPKPVDPPPIQQKPAAEAPPKKVPPASPVAVPPPAASPSPAAERTAAAAPSPRPVVPTPPRLSPPAAAAPAVPPAAAPLTFTQRLSTRERIHVLLIGNDREKLGEGRADVLLVLTFDPVERQLSLLSIPRDTRVTLPGRGPVKINAAYAYGGASLQTVTVERFLGIPMDKVVEVSLGGFRDAIDAVGGVTVHPRFSFSLDGETFQPGAMHLEGAQALAYARMRKQDPQGDLGRNERQQEVIRSLMGALAGLSSTELTAVLQRLESSLRTNFSPSEVVRLRATHAYLLDHQRVVRVQGVGRTIGRGWYYLVPDQERQRLHLLLR